MSNQTDVIVLGAGIIGVSVALHLQERGRSVVLVDRRGPGEETSHGNAGLIERSSVIPYAFPRGLRTLLSLASNRSIAVRYRPAFLANVLPWIARYWWHSSPRRLEQAAREMLPLIEASVAEHEHFEGAAGTAPLMRRGGWVEYYRSERAMAEALESAGQLGPYGLRFDVLDGAGLKALEPGLSGGVAGAVHWRDPVTVSDPGGITAAYARLFTARGGRLVPGDAQLLDEDGGRWSLDTPAGLFSAAEAVVALGPWSVDLTRRLGYRLPVAVKRGYHMHYAAENGATLTHPLCDAEAGFVLAPMARGIRLTTGIELASRDAASDAWQVRKAERIARSMFPLGAALDPEPWRGARPCLPDMKPIIGPAPRHRGLWFAFGHAHHGFTLGPATGRLLAEMMTGAAPFADPSPYGAARFAG